MKDSETQTLDQFVFGVLLLRCREDDLLLPPPPHLPPSLLVCGPHLWLWALQGFSVCELEQVSAHRRMSAKFVRLAERDFSGSSHVGEAAQGCSATAGEAFHPDAQ